MSRLFTILLLLLLSFQNVSAVISYDRASLDDAFLLPPQLQNEKLNSKVNFSFHDTELADILLMLSKIGDFNVVMPDKYNKKITVKLSNQRIIDAIEDITELTGLTYSFKNNSLLISGKDTQGQVFTSLPVLYHQASEIVTALNDSLFKQLAITQDPARSKPHASVDPTKNAVIVLGDADQVKAAKEFIATIDVPLLVKIYTPSFLDLADARKLISNNFSQSNSLKIKRYEQNSFMLTGVAEEVNLAMELLKQYDVIPRTISLVADFYAVRNIDLDIFLMRNNFIDYAKPYAFNANVTRGEAFKALFPHMDKIYQQKFDTNTKPAPNILGLNIDSHTSQLDPNSYSISILGETIPAATREDQIVILFDKDQLKLYKDIKKNLSKSHAELVMLVIKAI